MIAIVLALATNINRNEDGYPYQFTCKELTEHTFESLEQLQAFVDEADPKTLHNLVVLSDQPHNITAGNLYITNALLAAGIVEKYENTDNQ